MQGQRESEPGQRARLVRRAETGNPRQRCAASRLRPDTSSWIREAANCCSRSSPPEKNAPSLPAPPTLFSEWSNTFANPPTSCCHCRPASTPTSSKPAPAATDSKYETRKESTTSPPGWAKSGQHSGAKSTCHSQAGARAKRLPRFRRIRPFTATFGYRRGSPVMQCRRWREWERASADFTCGCPLLTPIFGWFHTRFKGRKGG
jgi:hypothetical protein